MAAAQWNRQAWVWLTDDRLTVPVEPPVSQAHACDAGGHRQDLIPSGASLPTDHLYPLLHRKATMARLQIDPSTSVDTDSIVKVEFHDDESSPLSQRADLFVIREAALELAVPTKVDSIPVLQTLRQVIGSDTGHTGWIRIRGSETVRSRSDAYVNLQKVRTMKFGTAANGEIAELRAEHGITLGEVNVSALQQLRGLGVF